MRTLVVFDERLLPGERYLRVEHRGRHGWRRLVDVDPGDKVAVAVLAQGLIDRLDGDWNDDDGEEGGR
jgi:hypothetical protein